MAQALPLYLPLDLPLDYPIYVQHGVIGELGAIVERTAPAHRYAIVSDTRVASFHGARLLDLPHAPYDGGAWMHWHYDVGY